MRLRFFVAAAAMLSSSLAARADTYTYTLVEGGSSATFTEPSILTSETTITDPTSSNGVESITLDPTGKGTLMGSVSNCAGYASCDLVQIGSVGYLNYFSEPLTGIGSYTAYVSLTDASVTITEMPGSPASVTPEPSSFLLLGTGLLGMAGVMRKRFA